MVRRRIAKNFLKKEDFIKKRENPVSSRISRFESWSGRLLKMIDVHCHLEQKDYDKDREEVIKKCREKMKAVISSSPHKDDFNTAIDLHNKYSGFVYICLGLHPMYIRELSEKDILNSISFIRRHKDELSAVGEVGLDYYHVKEKEWQDKQKEMFRRFIRLAKELNKPLVIHCRDAFEDTIKILEEEKAEKVMFHLFGDKKSCSKVLDNGWFISIGPLLLRSKTIKKIARFMPLERIMLETDSPWFGFGERGTPLNVIKTAEKIAEVKKATITEVEEQTDLNARNFFKID